MNFRRGSSTRKRARVSIERSDERRTERLLSDGLKRIIFISVVRKQFQLLSTNESSTVEPSGYMNTCYVNVLLYLNVLLHSTMRTVYFLHIQRKSLLILQYTIIQFGCNKSVYARVNVFTHCS